MDLRIVNTCNNDCLYCLEQSYRGKDKFINLPIIYDIIKQSNDKNITFYGWNSILHPNIIEIINFCKNIWINSIWLLTNSYWLTDNLFTILLKNWLNSIWIYFNCFDKNKHELIVNWWISYNQLLKNLEFISKSWIYKKIIININNQNISDLYKDLIILRTKYGFKDFEFINYFPFDRPYNNYKNILEYDYENNREYIDKIFIIINKFNLNVNFYKFPKNFFWNFPNFYSYEKWILNQIWLEDIERLSLKSGVPFCFSENRCSNCFIKDNCLFYE